MPETSADMEQFLADVRAEQQKVDSSGPSLMHCSRNGNFLGFPGLSSSPSSKVSSFFDPRISNPELCVGPQRVVGSGKPYTPKNPDPLPPNLKTRKPKPEAMQSKTQSTVPSRGPNSSPTPKSSWMV